MLGMKGHQNSNGTGRKKRHAGNENQIQRARKKKPAQEAESDKGNEKSATHHERRKVKRYREQKKQMDGRGHN